MSVNSSNSGISNIHQIMYKESKEIVDKECVWTNSLFCPRVPNDMDKASLREAIETSFAVKVERIDMNNSLKTGCVQAFIHLNFWNDGDNKTKKLKHILMTSSTPYVWNIWSVKLNLFVNHKPIPTPTQNDHQLANSLVICRELIDKQADMINGLNNQLENQRLIVQTHESHISALFQQQNMLLFQLKQQQQVCYRLGYPPNVGPNVGYPPPLAAVNNGFGHTLPVPPPQV